MNQSQKIKNQKQTLKTLNLEIKQRTQYQLNQEKQIKQVFEEGNDILLDLNDVILKKKREIRDLDFEIIDRKSIITGLVLEEEQITSTQKPIIAI